MIHINLDKKREKNKIRALSPIAFEEYMANLFRECGYEVTQTPPTNDGGKDLILQYDGRKYYVECKHFTEGAVGREIIQKLVGAGIVDGDVDGFIVATTSYYNDNAIACMEKSNVPLFLLDLEDIISISINSDKQIMTDLFLLNGSFQKQMYEDVQREKLLVKRIDDLEKQLELQNKKLLELEKYKKIIPNFGNLSDYSFVVDKYWVNYNSIKEFLFCDCCVVQCLYYSDRGAGEKLFMKILFDRNTDKYYILAETVFNCIKNELVYQKEYNPPLSWYAKKDINKSKLRDYVFSMLNQKKSR